MRRNRTIVGLCTALMLLGYVTITRAEASEQIIFSGVGFGTFDGTETPVGFWIWCQENNPSPHAEYAGECAGAMYFYALGITKAIEGDVDELEEGVYQMTVTSRNAASVACILTNELNEEGEVEHGPNNTVRVDCATPNGSGVSTNAVVNVTGPPEEE
jgi:hypothetical protein